MQDLLMVVKHQAIVFLGLTSFLAPIPVAFAARACQNMLWQGDGGGKRGGRLRR